jgi:Ca2+-binding EF-hand superfamily protein
VTKHFAIVAVMVVGWSIAAARADDKPATGAPDANAPGTGAQDSGAMFAELDKNKDGQLTGDEIPEDKKRLFERLLRVADKNSDGKLSAEEFAAGLKPRQQGGAAASPADLQTGKGERKGLERLFKRADTNGDGKITLDEVPEERRERFKKLIARGDKDGDGMLNEQEFTAAIAAVEGQNSPEGKGPEGLKRLFKRLDKNGDGKVTADEVPQERRPMIERLLRRGDKDGDKALSLEEFTAVFSKMRPDNGPSAGVGRPPMPPGGGPPFPSLFSALDADHDGRLSASEISAAAEVIRKLDKNGDGFVTPDEIMAQ